MDFLSGTQAGGLSQFQPELAIEECHALALRLCSSLLAHKRIESDSAEIDEAADACTTVVLSLSATIRDKQKTRAPHSSRCSCDSCVAAESCRHYDRKRDGELIEREE